MIWAFRRAHPRSRGENFAEAGISTSMRGSSPLTRGKQAQRIWERDDLGLIPAHAGKTSSWGSVRAACRAHPRSRGENLNLPGRPSLRSGSSPLTRGKPPPRRKALYGIGLIPAHAGKTGRTCLEGTHERAHPRSRGENLWPRRGADTRSGSSPLTRGKLAGALPPPRPPGLIPAHAGKTSVILSRRSTQRAHPRSRGENA